MSAVEKALMVGYPNGLWDSKNNPPLYRMGITTSHPAINFNQAGCGVIDMAFFPGLSGSPILIVDEHTYTDKFRNSFFGKNRIHFIGVLFEGPVTEIEENFTRKV